MRIEKHQSENSVCIVFRHQSACGIQRKYQYDCFMLLSIRDREKVSYISANVFVFYQIIVFMPIFFSLRKLPIMRRCKKLVMHCLLVLHYHFSFHVGLFILSGKTFMLNSFFIDSYFLLIPFGSNPV